MILDMERYNFDSLTHEEATSVLARQRLVTQMVKDVFPTSLQVWFGEGAGGWSPAGLSTSGYHHPTAPWKGPQSPNLYHIQEPIGTRNKINWTYDVAIERGIAPEDVVIIPWIALGCAYRRYGTRWRFEYTTQYNPWLSLQLGREIDHPWWFGHEDRWWKYARWNAVPSLISMVSLRASFRCRRY